MYNKLTIHKSTYYNFLLEFEFPRVRGSLIVHVLRKPFGKEPHSPAYS